jgi:hypothetical protein
MGLIVYPAIYAIWRWNFDLKPKLQLQTVAEYKKEENENVNQE